MKGHHVILVTPPPFGGEPDYVRPFAVAVRKVADARGLITADLFTALSGERNRAKCFSGEGSMALSEKGRKTVLKTLSDAIRKR